MVVAREGPPPVSSQMTSKTLKDIKRADQAEHEQYRAAGGQVIDQKRCTAVAPSTAAAS